ncbi:hypothetical protein [Flavobacterium cerinum]|uniref:Cyclic nucleotide-binding domain-containing protein n=1 Tax=Flavobacterium cerinum TaxID=2502784 RepID=A0ABY5IT23_9FLAO|nr:hypothetical protein [Flavobacterium cerinum]UUC44913.1 hypothetical protein NOX80_14940 [Flavobacterium cerinum]
MEFKLKPFHKNCYPKQGILIKGSDAELWLQEIYYTLGIKPENTRIYPLPGKKPNELFGCLVVPQQNVKMTDIGKNSHMQCVHNKLFIPENAIVFPELIEAEWTKQFSADGYVMHPEIGLIELDQEVDWNLLLEMPKEATVVMNKPSGGVLIPKTIRSYSIETDQEKLAEAIEEQAGTPDAKNVPFNMDKIMKGNQREIDKLLAYLEKHPDQALSLGIPIDITGSGRGIGNGSYVFRKGIGSTFKMDPDVRKFLYLLGAIVGLLLIIGLFSGESEAGSNTFFIFFIILLARFIYSFLGKNETNNDNFGGNVVISNDKFEILRNRYEKLAEEHIKRKEYKKAAGIYLQLLKNHFKAAQVLEDGGYYGEAGAIYLKHCKDKPRAADCFEKGKLYKQAIEIYKELGEMEKVADLYALLKQEKEANRYYEMVADDYIKKKQYVRASLIYRKKMNQPLKGQTMLLEGWHQKLSAGDCLSNYFSNIEDKELLTVEIKRFYKEELKADRNWEFLGVIKKEFDKHDALQEPVRAIAYEIIAGCIDINPWMTTELVGFNPNNKSLSRDIIKFRNSKKKRN